MSVIKTFKTQTQTQTHMVHLPCQGGIYNCVITCVILVHQVSHVETAAGRGVEPRASRLLRPDLADLGAVAKRAQSGRLHAAPGRYTPTQQQMGTSQKMFLKL